MGQSPIIYLFNRYGFSKVTGLINVKALLSRRVICEELKYRYGREELKYFVLGLGYDDHIVMRNIEAVMTESRN